MNITRQLSNQSIYKFITDYENTYFKQNLSENVSNILNMQSDQQTCIQIVKHLPKFSRLLENWFHIKASNEYVNLY